MLIFKILKNLHKNWFFVKKLMYGTCYVHFILIFLSLIIAYYSSIPLILKVTPQESVICYVSHMCVVLRVKISAPTSFNIISDMNSRIMIIYKYFFIDN